MNKIFSQLRKLVTGKKKNYAEKQIAVLSGDSRKTRLGL